ncbi:MAG: alkaline phosphatase family protein, partial [Ktedonobacteraceae bacterium]
MPQIIILGISGLAADLLQTYGPSLPNLQHLMRQSPFLHLRSTIAPALRPTWGSVYTGLNPANRKIYGPGPQTLQAKPFWERAAHAGKRVCVLNPLLTSTNCAIGDIERIIPDIS